MAGEDWGGAIEREGTAGKHQSKRQQHCLISNTRTNTHLSLSLILGFTPASLTSATMSYRMVAAAGRLATASKNMMNVSVQKLYLRLTAWVAPGYVPRHHRPMSVLRCYQSDRKLTEMRW